MEQAFPHLRTGAAPFVGMILLAFGCTGTMIGNGDPMAMDPLPDVDAGPPPATADGGDAVPQEPVFDEEGMHFTHVISYLSTGKQTVEAPGPDLVPGANLDGKGTGECMHDDYRSYPPEKEDGVDNQVFRMETTLALLQLDLEALLQKAVLDGDVLILVELLGVDDLTTDDNVTIELYQARTSTGGAPTVTDAAPKRINPDQTFDVVDTAPATYLSRSTGRIVDGRFEARGIDVTLEVPTQGKVLALQIEDGVIRFDMREATLERGILAGALNVDALVKEALQFTTLPEETVRAVLKKFADLSGAAPCDAISVGLDFEGAPAVRGNTVAP
ncbi:MAG: hypothetical protein KC416_01205 [Myxococcales bacterium]|nr:hypothetical protein [Myxococcales bacterium]